MVAPMDPRTGKKYCNTPLSKMRKGCGLTLLQVAERLGRKPAFAQTVSNVENGAETASTGLLKTLASLYGVTHAAILVAATDTFEHGRTMKRHRGRQMKVEALRPK